MIYCYVDRPKAINDSSKILIGNKGSFFKLLLNCLNFEKLTHTYIIWSHKRKYIHLVNIYKESQLFTKILILYMFLNVKLLLYFILFLAAIINIIYSFLVGYMSSWAIFCLSQLISTIEKRKTDSSLQINSVFDLFYFEEINTY